MPNELALADNPWSSTDLIRAFADGAGRMANSGLVPAHFRGKPDDCFVALMTAHQLRINPLLLMQNTYIISGTPAFKAQFTIALARNSGRFSDIDWEIAGSGDSLVVTCIGKRPGLADVRVSVSMATAVADGWTKNVKYKSMPELMLRYRSAAQLVRLYAPDVLLGLQTDDEVEGAQPEAPEVVIAREATTGAARIAEIDATEADKAAAAKLANAIRGAFLRGKSSDWMKSFGVRHGINGRRLEQLSTAELSAIIRIEQEAAASAASAVQDAEIVEEGGEE